TNMSFYTYFESPVGRLLLTSNGKALTGVYFDDHRQDPVFADKSERDDTLQPLAETVKQLELYFSRKLKKFDLPIALVGTEFQKEVWTTLNQIEYGQTWTYGDLACRVGRPNGSRAVGLAVGRNPISIIIPCHRVIGANGKLTGYGGGLWRKEKLLTLEAASVQKRILQAAH
ncbi:MAG TPA: methylated-DNA--[protein]-cysteine S-methyltransferase, partial [Candidatus Obscuribacterales bacterium]